jgi:hypothetical protein
MKSITIVLSSTAVMLLATGAVLAQSAGFGGNPTTSRNQVPAPSIDNPSDPAAGNPGSRAQIPTAPAAKRDLYRSGTTLPGAGAPPPADEATRKPITSDPAP